MERSWREVSIAPTASFFGRNLWPMRIAIALVAAAGAWFTFSVFVQNTWWSASGMSSDPGTFRAKLPLDYEFCAPWSNDGEASARAEARKSGAQLITVKTKLPVAGGGQENLGVVLPKSARILKVWCGVTPEGFALRECSPARCNPPMTILVENNMYSQNRAMVATFVNAARNGMRPARGTLWVVWKDG